MRFTAEQYDVAIRNLQLAKKQLIEGTQDQGCSICGGSCHPDMCGFNPLYAQQLCIDISKQSIEMHETLHFLSGYVTHMGESVGPNKVVIDGKPADK